ncbi:MAG TPA: zinc ribbon domain-containing protein [Anaerolineae bacterium]|nr:zinc ribbon domain-containing protein [Anaerolineae bacterium]HQJ52423.1 zinc ribbon domain-containing protein [Anaerolineae bacterium]
MFCMKCGAQNADGQAYCIKCGAPLAKATYTSEQSPLSGVLSLSLGQKVSGTAALLALVCFFLPWVTVSCGTSWSLSGYELATFSTSSQYGSSELPWARVLLFAVPLAALLILGQVVRARNAEKDVQRSSAAAAAWLSVPGGLITLAALLYFEAARHDSSYGSLYMVIFKIEPAFILTLLAFVAVLVGARMDLSDTG